MLNWYQNRKYQHLEPQFSYNNDGDELKKFIKPSKTIYNSFMEYEIDTFHDYYYEKYKNERIKFMNQLVKKKYNNIRLRSILNINPLIDDNILLNILKFDDLGANTYGKNVNKKNFLMNYYFTLWSRLNRHKLNPGLYEDW